MNKDLPAHNYAKPVPEFPKLRKEVEDALTNECKTFLTQLRTRTIATTTINTRHISSHIIRRTIRARGRIDSRKGMANASSQMAAIMKEISRLERQMMRTDV